MGLLVRWFLANSFLSGLLALAWLLLRSGSRPSRLAYPCQQAALSAATLALAAPLLATLAGARRVAGRMLGSRTALAAVAVVLFVACGLWGFLSPGDATQLRRYQPPADYRAQVFHVTDCPEDPVGDRFPGLDNLLTLMGRHGLKLYRSNDSSPLSGPEGIITADDVIVIKINYQWTHRGGTNVDLLRGLIRALVDHPDGFRGEIVVAENTQFINDYGLDRLTNNAQDISLSPRDVIVAFQDLGFRVGSSCWSAIRTTQVDEYDTGDLQDGYIVYSGPTGGRISYPKFQTEHGTLLSIGKGIWISGEQRFDRDHLKVINMPVLKPHAVVYGVSGCVKNYMGLVTRELGTGSHDAIAIGLLGAVMAEIGPPDLNILDCIWINADPHLGPRASFRELRMDQLVASTDPIAADIWATTNILIPAFLANGYTPPWPYPDATPDDPGSVFRGYLDRSMAQLLAAGYRVTNDLDHINVYSWDGVSQDTPRRPRRRVAPS